MKETDNFPYIASNINQLWSSLFIEELIRHGITDYCVAPGSRSTPLTLAVANHPQANAHVHFDERGLGFLALGISQASQKPVVIITTSGTAVANLYPAVIEAKQSGNPLIIISADRPLTLIDCGANQAIDQQSIFANYPIFFTQLSQPSTEITASYLLTTIDHALNKQRDQQGPIHFNLPFAEPLYPSNEKIDFQCYLSSLRKWPENKRPFTRYIKSEQQFLPSDQTLNNKRVIVIIGKINNQQRQVAIADFCKKHHMALITDIQSSQCATSNALSYYDLLLNNDHFKQLLGQADIIIQFGEQLISKQLSTFIGHFAGELQVIHESDHRIDSNHRVDIRYNCDAIQWIKAQVHSAPRVTTPWLIELQQCHNDIAEKIIEPFLVAQPYSEMTVVEELDKQLQQKLEKNSPLFIGNSMPIRLADMLMKKIIVRFSLIEAQVALMVC
ncbi:2-succinyl-5-enolpyruvyl-6-hydroxy-3-cyclohexene-1-carboxylic-acid synthase [Psychromonas sp. KJ10-10]|uniref:2-succinyl-5-enolpyruvyl-6-hydroxy-3- cyclohexene-1-carboxylic-acid synthase n=1 Tax=Psychromonas sp. KJ10-10 TaxID=3391823 RepID=UPI0039B5FE38